MILVDALFVNKGGGAVLLDYLIEKALQHAKKDEFFFLLDPRFAKPANLEKNFIVIPNKLSERNKFYKKNRDRFQKIFCFGNTPPPIRTKAEVYTYVHNPKLLEAPARKFKRNYRKMYLKYLFIKLYNRNTDHYIVQIPTMLKMLMDLGLKDVAHCLTIPFYNTEKYKIGQPSFDTRVKDEFVFISTPSPQKNHPLLFDAWEYLLEKGLTPILHVTIDHTAPELITRLDELNKRGARIKNHGYIDPRELYFKCQYLIFPSTTESFGLPLIEAVDSGMKVLASDLPYVYEVIKPSLTFDPYDKASIADTVIKALNTEPAFPEIVTKNEVDKLIDMLA